MKIPRLLCLAACTCTVTWATPEHEAIQNYVLTLFHVYRQEPAKARQIYEKLQYQGLARAPHDALLIKLLPATGEFAQLLELQPHLDSELQKKTETQLALIKALERTNQHEQAHDKLITLNSADPANASVALLAVQLYITRQELENALCVIDAYLEKTAQNQGQYVFYFLKAQLNMQLHKLDQALEAAKKSINLYGDFDKGWLLYAFLQEQVGYLEAAKHGFVTFLELAGAHSDIVQHLVHLVFRQMALFANSTQLEFDQTRLDEGMALLGKMDYKAGVQKIESARRTPEPDNTARLAQLNSLISTGNWPHAFEVVRATLQAHPTDRAWYDVCLLMYKQDVATAHVKNVLKEVENKNPRLLLPVLYRADIMLRQKEYGQALACLTKVLSLANDPELKVKTLYQMCLIHYTQKRFDALEQRAAEGLKINGTYAPLCNLLAYYLVEQEKDLPHAQKLIACALAQEPDNPHYLDTQAYALLREHRLDDAWNLLEKLKMREPDDTCIAQHYQEVCALRSPEQGKTQAVAAATPR